MKNLKNLHLHIFALISILFITASSCKKNPSASPKVNSTCTLKNMNSYIPSKNYTVLKKRIDNFRSLASDFKSKLKIKFDDQPASDARFDMETTINNSYVGVHDTNGVLNTDTISFSIKNISKDSSGQPILDGNSMLNAYNNLVSQIITLDNSSTPVSIIKLDITSFDNDNTYFSAYVTTQQAVYTNIVECLSPSETPVPLTSWYYAMAINPWYHGLDSAIQARLNKYANAQNKPANYIIIQKTPVTDGWVGGIFQYDTGWWHAYNNQQLNVNQCNTYLSNYQNFLIYYQTTFVGGYGNNYVYVHHVGVYHEDGWTDCLPYTCPDDPPGSNIYCWHYMVFYYCQYIFNGQGNL